MVEASGLERTAGEMPGTRIGARSRDEVRDLLRRRRLAPKTISLYLTALARAAAWCRAEGLELEELGADDLDRYAATLPQTRPMLSHARAALRHYWSAIARRDAPVLEVAERVGRSGQAPDEGLAALELARRLVVAEGPVVTWRDVGYDPAWLRTRLVGRQLNRKTAVTYANALLRLQRWCARAGTSIETVSAAELEVYASLLPPGRSYRQLLRSALVHYFAAIRRQDPPTWAIRVPRKPRMLCRALDGDDALRLASAAIERDDRMGLAVVIGLYLGLRRFEIAKLRWADFSEGWLRLGGKGDVEANLPVHPVVQRYLQRQRNDSPFVFPGRWGAPVNPTTVWTWVRCVAVEAGLDAVPTHVLRHTALAVGNDVTGDLRAVQDFARHAEVETTAGYTRATVERLGRVAEAIGAFYRQEDDGFGNPPEREPLPTLSFRELVATIEGAHAVEAWASLAGPLSRRGWQLAGTLAGEGNLSLAFSPLLRATASVATTEGRPCFHIVRSPRADPDAGYDEWHFVDVADLLSLAPLFEKGLPVPGPDAGETDGRYWVLEDA